MEIRTISWEQTIPLRHSVLWPTKPPEYCHVEGDHDALHFGAFINDELVCVASVYLASDKARLRKFATKVDFQSKGIGSKMLTFILHSLKSTDARVFWCDARESALSFYQRFGMQPYGERFYKADVSYFKMEVIL
ncbi:GNAT family N-acetyltransferase [Thalassotalea fusca]